MKRLSNITNADKLRIPNAQVEINGKWFIAKPMGFFCLCLFTRIKYAWWIFIGKYDILKYQEDEQNANIK